MLYVFKKTIESWWNRDPFSESAAASYYAVFSLPGLLIIIIGIAATLFEEQSVETQILSYIHHVLGPDMVANVHAIVESTHYKDHNSWVVAAGSLALLFGATRLFVQLQKSLNAIWEVEVKKSADFTTFLKNRITALGVTVSIGFLLLVSLLLTAVLTSMSEWLAAQFSEITFYFFFALNYFLSLMTISVLFALIFKVLPDIHLKWRDAIKGGFLSALLFTVGEHGLSFYFKYAQPESAFGAAGSIILFLLWIFYSCLILLLGAEFTKTYMEKVSGEKADLSEIAKRHPHPK